MFNFKVGDKVVFVSKGSSIYEEVGTIKEVFNIQSINEIRPYAAHVIHNGNTVLTVLRHLVPLEIWESGLYKAMNEDE